MELPGGRVATRKRQLWKENEIAAKRNKMIQIKPKQKLCACAVAKLLLNFDAQLLNVIVFCKSRR